MMKTLLILFTALIYITPFQKRVDDTLNTSTNIITDNQLVTDVRFKISPNPAEGNMLSFELINDQKATIEIYSVIGKRVLNAAVSSKTFSLNISSLPGGVYLVKIQQGKHQKTLKLIRQ